MPCRFNFNETAAHTKYGNTFASNFHLKYHCILIYVCECLFSVFPCSQSNFESGATHSAYTMLYVEAKVSFFRCIFKLDEQLKEIGCDVWKWNWAMSIFYESIRPHTQAVAAIAIDIWPKNVPVDGQLWVYWPNIYINSEWNSFWFTSFWLWTCLSYALEFVLRYAFMGESTIKFSSAHCKFWKIVLQYS